MEAIGMELYRRNKPEKQPFAHLIIDDKNIPTGKFKANTCNATINALNSFLLSALFYSFMQPNQRGRLYWGLKPEIFIRLL